jgi:GT2 family glycosyltransferase
MNPQIEKYFVIIVHFGSAEVTNQALMTLFAGQSRPHLAVVIDHATTPFTTRVQAEHPVLIIRPASNSGYGGGINIGLGALLSRGATDRDMVIAMNNDIVVASSSMDSLQAWYRQHPDTMAGLHLRHLNLLTGRTQLDAGLLTQPYLDGAFMVGSYKTWTVLTGMPTDYFLYWEDVLFSQRARQRQIPLAALPELGITHQEHGSQLPPSQRLHYLVRNGALFLERELSIGWRSLWWLGNRLRYLYHRFVSRQPQATAVARALRDAFTHTTGPISRPHE